MRSRRAWRIRLRRTPVPASPQRPAESLPASPIKPVPVVPALVRLLEGRPPESRAAQPRTTAADWAARQPEPPTASLLALLVPQVGPVLVSLGLLVVSRLALP